MSYPDRRTGSDAKVLVSGENPEWAVVVEKIGRRSYRASLYVEHQGFTLARCEDDVEAESHCNSIGRSFVIALGKLLASQNASALRKAADIAGCKHSPTIARAILSSLPPAERVHVRLRPTAKKRGVRKVP